MKIRIEFGLYVSAAAGTLPPLAPPAAFAEALGDLDLPQVPAAGEMVDLLGGKQLPRAMPTMDGAFTGRLKVDFISRVQLPEGERVSVTLVDLVLRASEDAVLLRDFLNRETTITCTAVADEGD